MGIKPSAFDAIVLGSDPFIEGSRTGTAERMQAGYRAPSEVSRDVLRKNMHSSGEYAFLECFPTNMIRPQGIKAQSLDCIPISFVYCLWSRERSNSNPDSSCISTAEQSKDKFFVPSGCLPNPRRACKTPPRSAQHGTVTGLLRRWIGRMLVSPHGGAGASRRERDNPVVPLVHDDVELILVYDRVVQVRRDGEAHLLRTSMRTGDRSRRMNAPWR